MQTNPRLPIELVEQFAAGNGVVFVGEEVSRQAGLLARRQALAALAADLDDVPEDTPPADLAQYYEIEYGRPALVRRFRDQLEARPAFPGRMLDRVAALPASIIFTTNQDDLIEQALRTAHRRYVTVVRSTHPAIDLTDRLLIVKLHGDFSVPDGMVLTARDRERILTERSALDQLVELALQTRVALFVGFRAADPALRGILSRLPTHAAGPRRNLFCLVAEHAPYPVRDLEQRGVRVIAVGAGREHDDEAVAGWLDRLVQAVRDRRDASAAQRPTASADRSGLFAQVAGLLEGMGGQVTAVQRDAHTVDFVADVSLPGGSTRRRFRCVERTLGSADVRAVADLLAAEGGDDAWLIAYRRGVITAQARTEAASRRGLRVLSVAEFFQTVLRLDEYARRILNAYEASEVSRHWVDLACEVPQHDPAESAHLRTDGFDSVERFLDSWIDTPGRNHISILGDFGTGKTWLCRHYAATLARRYLDDCEHNRLPIPVSLRNAVGSLSLPEMITDLLANEYGLELPGGYRTFEFLNRCDSLVLIFDGFDEMHMQVDARKAEENFEELARVVLPDANCKVILTCRTGYFRTDIEGRGLLAGEGIRRIRLRHRPNFEILHLCPLDSDRIQRALQLRVAKDWEGYYTLIQRTYDLPDLAHRPILLNMIASTMPRLVAAERVSPATLYQTYTDEWIEKNIAEQRTFVDAETKRYFMQELAWEMWQRETLSIHYSELPKRVRDHFGIVDEISVDHFEHDVRTQTFLQRDKRGYYIFAHKSFMEFFIAQKIFGQIRDGDRTLLAEAQTSHETDQFIKDFLQQERRHVDTLTQWMRTGDDAVLRVNCAGILAKLNEPETTEVVLGALRTDQAARHLYLTAVLYRVLEIRWEAAARLAEERQAGEPAILRLPADQLPKVVERFCVEAANPRDGVARWFSAALLARIRDVAPAQVAQVLRQSLRTEQTPSTVALINGVLADAPAGPGGAASG